MEARWVGSSGMLLLFSFLSVPSAVPNIGAKGARWGRAQHCRRPRSSLDLAKAPPSAWIPQPYQYAAAGVQFAKAHWRELSRIPVQLALRLSALVVL